MSPTDVLNFWFGLPGSPEFAKPRPCWFRKDPAHDAALRVQFGATYDGALAGRLDHWRAAALPALALTLVLDQFPRNMYRDTPLAFAADALALSVAREAVARGFDRDLAAVQRWFFYLPFEHAEDLACQRRAVELFETLRGDPGSERAIDYAYRHLAVIERFGRFPHRNRILGREATPQEIEFLRQPGAAF